MEIIEMYFSISRIEKEEARRRKISS